MIFCDNLRAREGRRGNAGERTGVGREEGSGLEAVRVMCTHHKVKCSNGGKRGIARGKRIRHSGPCWSVGHPFLRNPPLSPSFSLRNRIGERVHLSAAAVVFAAQSGSAMWHGGGRSTKTGIPLGSPSLTSKLRTTLGKFGEFWAYIAYFLLVRLGRKSILKI